MEEASRGVAGRARWPRRDSREAPRLGVGDSSAGQGAGRGGACFGRAAVRGRPGGGGVAHTSVHERVCVYLPPLADWVG